MKTPNPSLRLIAALVAVLAAFVCVAAFIPDFGGPAQPRSFVSLRGESVELHGTGLYRLESRSFAAQGQAQDAVTLLFGVPLLLVSLLLAVRGSLRGALLLSGTFAYFTYTYATYAFCLQYNPLFLVYVALLSLSLAGLVSSLFHLDAEELKSRFSGSAVRRAAVVFDFFVGTMIFLMWMGRILPGLLGGKDATLIEHYTTLPIQVMDLAFVVPLAVLAGIHLARDRALGYLLSGLFLVKGLSLGLALGAMIVWSAVRGLPVNPAETAIFSAIILGGLTLSVLFVRAIR